MTRDDFVRVAKAWGRARAALSDRPEIVAALDAAAETLADDLARAYPLRLVRARFLAWCCDPDAFKRVRVHGREEG
jgi:hypothetical protein